jgi:hypothetical protein
VYMCVFSYQARLLSGQVGFSAMGCPVVISMMYIPV